VGIGRRPAARLEDLDDEREGDAIGQGIKQAGKII
jgi:hypothetical protein